MRRISIALLTVAILIGSFIAPAVVKADIPPVERVDLRTENGKVTDLGNGKYAVDTDMGVIHYKDNYADNSEQWKDIDLAMVDGKVTKAPYELTIDGLNVTVKDKRTGSITTLELIDTGDKGDKVAKPKLVIATGIATAKDIAPDTDLEITWENSRISYSRILKSDKAPTMATYNITQTGTGITLSTKAVDSKTDADKSVAVISEIKGGKLTEYIDTSKVKLTYPVKIDPTLDLNQTYNATDNYALYWWNPWTYNGTLTISRVGTTTKDSSYKWGSGFRYQNVTIPQGSTITAAYENFTCASSLSATTVNSVIIGQDSDNAAAITSMAEYKAVRGTLVGGANDNNITSASVPWNSIPAWTAETVYQSPDIGTIITEITGRAGWSSGASIILFWDDHAASSTNVTGTYRQVYNSRNGSKYPKLHIEYTTTAPTVTTQAGSSVADTTCTGNGNITNLNGGGNATIRGICYSSTNTFPSTSDSKAEETGGSFGTGAYTESLTGLTEGTTYYLRAYATNPGGTGYGTVVTILTKPAAPTNVSATDGDFPDKCVVTWTKSTSATAYKVYEGSNLLATLGNVATYDDTGTAGKPVITPGTATASDGTSSDYVTLSVAGESAANGATLTYKVTAGNATGYSGDSNTNTGYRNTTTLTYAWQRSAADSDASYSAIGGGTTDPYNDTGAPADGSGRYFKCVISMTGATNQTTTADRGYRLSAPTYDIENTPSATKAFGIIATNSTYYAKGTPPNNPVVDGDCTYTITNTGNVPIDISITGNNYTGGVGWTLGANAGANTVKMVAYKTGDNPASGVVLTTGGQAFISNLAAAGHTHWDFSLITGTFTDGVPKTTTIRLTSTVH